MKPCKHETVTTKTVKLRGRATSVLETCTNPNCRAARAIQPKATPWVDDNGNIV